MDLSKSELDERTSNLPNTSTYWRDITVLASATVFFGIGNNITFAQMATKMNSLQYAPWLLYATALPYTVLYLAIVLVKV